jgi:hypothetical protein
MAADANGTDLILLHSRAAGKATALRVTLPPGQEPADATHAQIEARMHEPLQFSPDGWHARNHDALCLLSEKQKLVICMHDKKGVKTAVRCAQMAFSFDALAVAALRATRRGATPLGQPARDILILHPTRRLSLCAGARLLCSVSVALPPLLALSPYARFSRDRDPRSRGARCSSCMLAALPERQQALPSSTTIAANM